MPHVLAWLNAFVWTNVLELPVYAWLLGRHFASWHRPLTLTLALNLLTHPAFTLWAVTTHASPHEVAFAELVIAAVEGSAAAFVLSRHSTCRTPRTTGFVAALLANGVSYGLALALR